MSGQYTAQPPKCADRQCDVLWKNSDGAVVFYVCWLCIVLLLVHLLLNRRPPSIKLKRGKREWEE